MGRRADILVFHKVFIMFKCWKFFYRFIVLLSSHSAFPEKGCTASTILLSAPPNVSMSVKCFIFQYFFFPFLPRSPLLPGTRTSCSASDISDPLTSSRSAHVTQVVTSVDPSLIKTVTPRSSLQHYWFHLPFSVSSFFPHNTSTWTTTSNLFVYLFWLLFVLSYQTICSTEAWNLVNLVN